MASFSIIVEQVKTAWETLFTHDCTTCRGTGKMTCPKCHGTKTLRMRPAAHKIQHAGLLKASQNSIPCDSAPLISSLHCSTAHFLDSLDRAQEEQGLHCSYRKKFHLPYVVTSYFLQTNPDDLYPCFACGPPTAYDADPDQEDDLDENYQIMDNMKFAASNRKVPLPFPPTAGTVMCPDCKGAAICQRHTPNLERMFGMEAPFWVDVRQCFAYLFLLWRTFCVMINEILTAFSLHFDY